MKEEDVGTVTILKYQFTNEDNKTQYSFEVMDKFDEPDEVERLQRMMLKSLELKGKLKNYKQLWIKNTVIF